MDNRIIEDQLDRYSYLNESHILVNFDCINETNPTDFNCHEHWMYRDEDGKNRNDPMAKVTCQGKIFCVSYSM